MKKMILAPLLFASSAVFGHGTVPYQASIAVKKATEAVELAQPKEVLKQLTTVNVAKIGHEEFNVTFTVQDGTQFLYWCGENEEVNPVVWECLAQ